MIAHAVLEERLGWLLDHSLQAGVLVVLVVAAQWVFRRQLTNRWRFALWWIVILRLVLPFSPQSAVSVFNYFHPSFRLAAASFHPAPARTSKPGQIDSVPVPSYSAASVRNQNLQDRAEPIAPAGQEVLAESEKLSAVPSTAPSAVRPIPSAAIIFSKQHSLKELLIPGAAALWLFGALGLGCVVAVQLIRFCRKLKISSMPADERLRELLIDCQREFGISRRIELLETDAVESPALFGLFRLRLLLPRGIGAQFTTRELRYIFLHELAHVKRGDLWLNWLMTALQIIHWFNPLIWLGFARLRADRELACDELALLCAGDRVGIAYGETVVKLLENLNRSAVVPGLLGILEDKKLMRRRMIMIANFRRPGRWSALAVLLLAGLAAAALTDAQSNRPASETNTTSTGAISQAAPTEAQASRPDLTGHVSAKGGVMLPVPATVFIATAGPKSGSSVFCPSCYPDCIKHSQTDKDGAFVIKSLDPQLKFQILAVAKGYQPKYVNRVDPTNGPKKIELSPIELGDAAPDQSARGRIVDSKGNPIEDAVVEFQMYRDKYGGGRGGAVEGMDPLAVTDTNGEFLLTAKFPFANITVKMSARGFAPKIIDTLESGAKTNELVLTEGAAITGRVLDQGKPLAGINIGVSGANGNFPEYVGHFEIGTDSAGKFAFQNLPSDTKYFIYGIMDSVKSRGSIPVKEILSGKNGDTTDVGDLNVEKGNRLAGRVVLSDGQPVPPKTRLLVGRNDGAWDSRQIMLDRDGKFDVAGLPSEIISLELSIKGYFVSQKNGKASINVGLEGRVDHDITNLVILMEKGESPKEDFSRYAFEEKEMIRGLPLSGAEVTNRPSRDWAISGIVRDRDSKQRIDRFTVTPGFESFATPDDWAETDRVVGTNGVYCVYLGKLGPQPILKVEAEGYLPQRFPVLAENSTNVDVLLEKGSGLSGTVENADGGPAAGATVVLLSGQMNGPVFNHSGEISSGNSDILRRTDGNGRFAFKPTFLSIRSLVASSSNGFAAVSLGEFKNNPVIKLDPYGKVAGNFKRVGGHSTNETLELKFNGTNTAGLEMWNAAAADPDGNFAFDQVPPGRLLLGVRLTRPGNAGWSTEDLQTIDVPPGQALSVNIVKTNHSFSPVPAKVFPHGDKGVVYLADGSWYKLSDSPQVIPGEEIQGVILSPGGSPAGNATVALGVEGSSLELGRGEFRQGGTAPITKSGPDGKFHFPMYEGTKSVCALSEEGYGQIPLAQFQAEHKIVLQKWGRIKGTLHLGPQLGTNEQICIYWSVLTPNQPSLSADVFFAETDNKGRFSISYIPPSKQVIGLRDFFGSGSSLEPLATIQVKAGEDTIVDIGGDTRILSGRLNLPPGEKLNQYRQIMFQTPVALMEKIQKLKSRKEMEHFYKSEEYRVSMQNAKTYFAPIAADGSFEIKGMLPGEYGLELDQTLPGDPPTYIMYYPANAIKVPSAANKEDDSVVSLGDIQMEKHILKSE